MKVPGKKPTKLKKTKLSREELKGTKDTSTFYIDNESDVPEKINHPNHYGGEDNPYEVIKVLEAVLPREHFIGFCRGNSLKYGMRAGKKEGESFTEDQKKQTWYDNRLADFLERNPE